MDYIVRRFVGRRAKRNASHYFVRPIVWMVGRRCILAGAFPVTGQKKAFSYGIIFQNRRKSGVSGITSVYSVAYG